MVSLFKSNKSTPSKPSKDGKPSSSGPASGSGIARPVSPTQAAKEKAQIRRAQVRKAQIQHRQRKANYIKQLELDIVQIREMIIEAERESKQLRSENELIRQKLTIVANPGAAAAAGVGLAPPVLPTLPNVTPMDAIVATGGQPSVSPTGTAGFLSVGSAGGSPVFTPAMQGAPPSATDTSFFSDPGLDDSTVSLQMDDAMDYPCLQFTRHSSPSSVSMGGGTSSTATSPPPMGSPADMQQHITMQPATGIPGIDLTLEQTDQAINFILALEHVCWGHFHASDFDQESDGKESAHALMATSIALSTAPPQVFKQLNKTQRNVWFTPSALSSNPIAGDISWKTGSGGLSLQSLFGLASSLNPGDKELTPIQAWFELANNFDVELLLDVVVMDNLKREFHGVVKCVHYGASIERSAFESVVSRVIGGALAVDDSDPVPGFESPSLEGGFGGELESSSMGMVSHQTL